MDWKVLAVRPKEAKWSSPLSCGPSGKEGTERGARLPLSRRCGRSPPPPPTLVMNVGHAIPGEDPGGADEWIPNGVGQIYEWRP